MMFSTEKGELNWLVDWAVAIFVKKVSLDLFSCGCEIYWWGLCVMICRWCSSFSGCDLIRAPPRDAEHKRHLFAFVEQISASISFDPADTDQTKRQRQITKEMGSRVSLIGRGRFQGQQVLMLFPTAVFQYPSFGLYFFDLHTITCDRTCIFLYYR
jgi:hypothetical protein